MSGKIIEKLGYWRPRTVKTYDRAYVINRPRIHFWLGTGAKPTKAVHRILENFELVPKLPPYFGSKHTYEKPEKEIKAHEWSVFRMDKGYDKDAIINQRLQDELRIMESRIKIEGEIFNPVDIEDAKTTDIDSDDADVFERQIKFDEIKKRFEKHKEYSLDKMRGNDYKFNNYLRKMEKLSKSKYGGLDVAGYKDYLNSLMEFEKIRYNFNSSKYTDIDDRMDVGKLNITLSVSIH